MQGLPAPSRHVALALQGAPSDVSTPMTSTVGLRPRRLAEEAGELGRVKKSQVEEARNVLAARCASWPAPRVSS